MRWSYEYRDDVYTSVMKLVSMWCCWCWLMSLSQPSGAGGEGTGKGNYRPQQQLHRV